jgi:hypothetical protein
MELHEAQHWLEQHGWQPLRSGCYQAVVGDTKVRLRVVGSMFLIREYELSGRRKWRYAFTRSGWESAQDLTEGWGRITDEEDLRPCLMTSRSTLFAAD